MVPKKVLVLKKMFVPKKLWVPEKMWVPENFWVWSGLVWRLLAGVCAVGDCARSSQQLALPGLYGPGGQGYSMGQGYQGGRGTLWARATLWARGTLQTTSFTIVVHIVEYCSSLYKMYYT